MTLSRYIINIILVNTMNICNLISKSFLSGKSWTSWASSKTSYSIHDWISDRPNNAGSTRLYCSVKNDYRVVARWETDNLIISGWLVIVIRLMWEVNSGLGSRSRKLYSMLVMVKSKCSQNCTGVLWIKN